MKKEFEQWNGFSGRLWKEGVDVRDFIQNNYTPYDGDDSFLEGPTEATDKLWGRSCRNSRKKSGQRAAYWIWKQMLLLVHHSLRPGLHR